MKLENEEISIVVQNRLARMPYQTKAREDWIIDYLFGFGEISVCDAEDFGTFSKYEIDSDSSIVGWLLISDKEIIWCRRIYGPTTIINRYGE